MHRAAAYPPACGPRPLPLLDAAPEEFLSQALASVARAISRLNLMLEAALLLQHDVFGSLRSRVPHAGALRQLRRGRSFSSSALRRSVVVPVAPWPSAAGRGETLRYGDLLKPSGPNGIRRPRGRNAVPDALASDVVAGGLCYGCGSCSSWPDRGGRRSKTRGRPRAI